MKCQRIEERYNIKRNQADYWEEIARINAKGTLDSGWKYRVPEYDVSCNQGLIDSEISSACVEMMNIFDYYFDMIKRNNSAFVVASCYDLLENILRDAGYLSLYKPAFYNYNDSAFDDDLPF